MHPIQRAVAAAVTLGAVSASHLGAQQLEPRAVPSRGIESFTFQSPSMGVRYGVNVGLPVGFTPGAGRKYPALVSTDGDWAFLGVYDAAHSLMEQQAIEGLFVISIGSPLEAGDSAWVRRRIYEFSPPNWDMKDPFGQEVTKACQTYRSPAGRCAGGAPSFLNAIVTELIPLVAAKYPIDPAQLGLFGISAGGFFASWTIFQPNSPFRKYIISSPAMAYGDGEIFRQEARYASGHKDLGVGIYFGAGGLEIQDQFLEGTGRIVSGMTHLAGVLTGRRYPGLKMVSEIHPGMGHGDVMGTSVVRGLRSLYGK